MADTPSSPLSALRAELARRGLSGFLIPRADRHQGEYVPAADARLGHVTGFTGSAGLAYVDASQAVLFVDGRYELQGEEQAGPNGFDVAPMRTTAPTGWLAENAPKAAKIGFDPWLHTASALEKFVKAAAERDAELVAVDTNPIDAVWTGRPARPRASAWVHPESLAGESAADKRARLAAGLARAEISAAVVSQPDSICWLLNLRGGDIEHTPLLLAYGLLRADGSVELFTEPDKIGDPLRAALGGEVRVSDWDAFPEALAAFSGRRVSVDRDRDPVAAGRLLEAAGAEVVWRADPCVGPKARKNAVELGGAREAHLRDGAAMAEALAWIDEAAPSGALTEMVVAEALIRFRRETAERLGGQLFRAESFPAIVGFGPNGAIVHYRVTPQSSRAITGDGLLLLDSGGQFPDGTTDVTRTIAIGAPSDEERAAFTLVLKGMIAVSRLRFPEKVPGRRIEAAARAALWAEGLDFDHGVGHGVGSFLGVHEGPQSLSANGAAALEAGMILSNEPGCYAAGRYGIRIENLIIVGDAEAVSGGLGDRPMHAFETLTLVPIDRRLIDGARLSADERAWIDAYHARVLKEIGPLVGGATRGWLTAACAPLA